MNAANSTIDDLQSEKQQLLSQIQHWKKEAIKWKTRCNHRTEQNRLLNQSVLNLAQKLKDERAITIKTSSCLFKQNHVLHGYIFLPSEDIRKLTSDAEIDFVVRNKLVWFIPWEERRTHLIQIYDNPLPSSVELPALTFASVFLRTFTQTGPTIYVVVQYEDDMYNIVQGLIGTVPSGNLVLRLSPLKPNVIVSDCLTLKDAMGVLKKTFDQLLRDVWIVMQNEESYSFVPLSQFVAMSFIPDATLYNVNTLTQVNDPVCLQNAINNFLTNYMAPSEKQNEADVTLQRDLDDMFSASYEPLQQPTFQPHVTDIDYQVPQDPSRLHQYFMANPSPYQAEFPTNSSVNVVARFVPTYAKDLIASMMSNERPWFPSPRPSNQL